MRSGGYLFLHGFLGQPEDFDRLRAALGPHRGTAPDLGRACAPDFGAQVAALAAQIDHPGPVIGYSLGARLALALLVAFPEKVERACLIGVNPGLEDEREQSARREHDRGWLERLATHGRADFLDAWEAQPLFASQTDLPAARQQRQARESLPDAAIVRGLSVLGLAEMPNLWPTLETVRAPVDLIAGGLDPKFCAIGRRMSTKLPQVRLHVVENVGHNVLLEAPEVIARIVVAPWEAAGVDP